MAAFCLAVTADFNGHSYGRIGGRDPDLMAIAQENVMNQQLGVHSEVGKLRQVIVCRPGLAHERLTPGNCEDLLFDDVFWVHEAKNDHHDFCSKMAEHGVEVLDVHDLLAETMARADARAWLLDRRISANSVGVGMLQDLRAWLEEINGEKLAAYLIGVCHPTFTEHAFHP